MDKSIKEYTLDDLRKAFEGGRKSVKPVLKCEPWGDMDFYADLEVITSFKEWMHINYNKQFKKEMLNGQSHKV